MELKYEVKENADLVVTATYSKEEISVLSKQVIEVACQDVTVKGFRKGKAPVEIASKYVSNETIMEKLIRKIEKKDSIHFLDKYEGTRQILNVRPEANYDFNKDGQLIFTVHYALESEVILGKYKELGVKLAEVTVSDADVDAKIADLLKDEATLEVSSEAACEGDTVNIDFEGSVNGILFDGGTAKSYDLALGKHMFVPGFEEQLVGIKANETKTITVKFPENYVENLAGKEAQFKVKCNEVKKVVLPELNDETASSFEKYTVKTVAELKAAIKEELSKEKEESAKNGKIDEVLKACLKDSKFDLSKLFVAEYADELREQTLSQVKSYGVELKDYLKIINLSEEDFNKSFVERAENEIKNDLLISNIAKAEDLKETDENILAKGKEIYGKEIAQNSNEFINVKVYLIKNKVFEFILANN